MANVVQLNVAKHKDLKIIRERSAEYGDNVMMAMTFPAEFRSVQTYYPILFKKDESQNSFHALALFGLEDGENLFLDGGRWCAGYIPLMMERLPFLIGVQKNESGSKQEERRVIHIDMDSKRVSRSQGEPLFDGTGKNTEFLERSAAILETIHHWNIESESFMKALIENELLEGVTIDITLANGTKGELQGFYVISEEKLLKLSDTAVAKLHKNNYLQSIYMALASLSNIRVLSDLKNNKADALPEFS